MPIDPRYIEQLESQIVEQNRLRAQVKELEARIRELDPTLQSFNNTNRSQQFLTPPESSNTHTHSGPYLSPVDSNLSQSHSPRYLFYSEDRAIDGPHSNPLFTSLESAEQDAATDPGIFEVGDAGKGWYLGSASGSMAMWLSHKLMNSGLYEFYQEHCVIW